MLRILIFNIESSLFELQEIYIYDRSVFFIKIAFSFVLLIEVSFFRNRELVAEVSPRHSTSNPDTDIKKPGENIKLALELARLALELARVALARPLAALSSLSLSVSHFQNMYVYYK